MNTGFFGAVRRSGSGQFLAMGGGRAMETLLFPWFWSGVHFVYGSVQLDSGGVNSDCSTDSIGSYRID
jgi:hypothetical protein